MSEPEQEKMNLGTFLMSVHPGKAVQIEQCYDSRNEQLSQPQIILYCDDDMCKANMWFDCVHGWDQSEIDECRPVSLLYQCRHCKSSSRWFGLLVTPSSNYLTTVLKLGEQPPFGPHTPARVISLVGNNRELFLKGRAAEAHGLGIGAFTYYRRVVENEWQRFIGEAIKVAKKLNLQTKDLEAAKDERQFDKAVKIVKDAIPQVLLIDGHNPMALLYKMLSKGVHELTDDQCLDLAKHIRVILVDFAERVTEALRERQELGESLTKLFQSDKPQEPSVGDSQERPAE